MSRFLATILTFALCAGLAVAARPGDFAPIGPGGGGLTLNPVISPHDPNTVLLSADLTGSYITRDAGKTWRMFNLRGSVHSFVFDPADAKTIYAVGNGLWRSTDDGQTWRLVWPKPSTIKSVQMNSDTAEENIVADPNPVGRVAALAIQPGKPETLYAAAFKDSGTALFASRDFGETWEKQADLAETPLRMWIGGGAVYAGGPHGVAEVRGKEVTQHSAPAHVIFLSVAGGIPKTGPPIFYAVSDRAAYYWRDGGDTWSRIEMPGSGAQLAAVNASEDHPEIAYVSYGRLVLDDKMWFGVARTHDAAKSWDLIWKQEGNQAPANVHDDWATELIGPTWAGIPISFGVGGADPNLCYATDKGRVFKTTDGGANWNAVYSVRVHGAQWDTNGMDVSTSYGIHFDPFDLKRRFITYTDIGMFRSEDAGRSWTRSLDGAPPQWTNTAYWMVFDPEVRGRVWAVLSFMHGLPHPQMWRKRSPLTYGGGPIRSTDGGRTWRASNAGMDQTAPTHILLDPTSPKDARVLYVTGLGRGVYKSTDDGKTWAMRNSGITQKDPLAWRMARAGDGTLYLLIARRSDDGKIGNDGDGAIYKSTDGADSWTPVAMPAGVNDPSGMAVDPRDPKRLYLAAWPRAAGVKGEGGGLYFSEDGGKTWRVMFDRDQHLYDVTIDPRDPDILYTTGFESSAWRSADRGAHWTRIPGYNFKWGHRVIPDPEDANKVYITTFGGSVWHGAVNGPDEPVDILTPEMEPGK